jgi:hypothetical protein
MTNNDRFLMGCALAAGLVVATIIGSRALVRVKGDNTISVTGSAKRRIKSDLVTWSATVTAHGSDVKGSYKQLNAGAKKLREWLTKRGVTAEQMKVFSVDTKALHPHNAKTGELNEETITGYELTQTIQVKSGDCEGVAKMAREVTELLDEGLEVSSDALNFTYTKIGDLKIKLLAEAAKDARVRAENMAVATGARIGQLRSSRMGVIQINPPDSTEVSNEGNNDTTTVEKDVITVVGATFAID